MSYSEHWRREFLARNPEYERQSQVLQQEPVEPAFPSPADPLLWSAAFPQAIATLSLPSGVTHVTGPSEVAEAIPNKIHKTGQEKLLPSEIVTQACYLRRRLQLTQQAFAKQMGISSRTLQDWEQGRRQPNGPGRALLLFWIAQQAKRSSNI